MDSIKPARSQVQRRAGAGIRNLAICMVVFALPAAIPARAATVTRFAGPTSSQPLALTADGGFLVVANPDNNSVTFFDVRSDRNRKLAEVPVQIEPNGVAFLPDGRKAYVANTVSGTVSVIKTNMANGVISKPSLHIAVGTEPYGLVLTPNGKKLYVSNARSNSISVIDTATDAVVATIAVDAEPRGLSVSNDGDTDDNDESLYVTHMLAFPQPGKTDGQDDAKAGLVTVLSTAGNAVLTTVKINPLADTGFKATGDALSRIPAGDPAIPANFTFTTGAYPNQLNNVAIRGNFAYLPNTGASPNGPVRFDVNTQSLLSVVNRLTNLDAGRTINMQVAVKNQVVAPRLFITQPWAIAFKNSADEGYVVSAASNHVVKLAVDAATGAAAVQNDRLDPQRVLQIKVGKNPRGIVINSADTRAYVMNYVSRDVSVINLASDAVMASMRSANLPTPGSLADKVQIGKELYNTSIGEFDAAPGLAVPIVGRMSDSGWGSCASCHTPFATSDNVVWIFAAGPRRTIAQHADFSSADPLRNTMRSLNWSANRDEQEDFENNIRAVSGGLGLIVQADGITPDINTPDLLSTANGGRNQLKVRGVGGWDAIKAFIQFGVRAPISPVAKTEPDVVSGRALFISANCQQCHGGPQWTTAKLRFTPPPRQARSQMAN